MVGGSFKKLNSRHIRRVYLAKIIKTGNSLDKRILGLSPYPLDESFPDYVTRQLYRGGHTYISLVVVELVDKDDD